MKDEQPNLQPQLRISFACIYDLLDTLLGVLLFLVGPDLQDSLERHEGVP